MVQTFKREFMTREVAWAYFQGLRNGVSLLVNRPDVVITVEGGCWVVWLEDDSETGE